MPKSFLSVRAASIACLGIIAWPLMAADHQDSPQVVADPTADIADVFAWMTTDTNEVNLVMTIGRDVPENFQFSDAVEYVFQVTSQSAYGAGDGQTTELTCSFTTEQMATCSIGDVTVNGDASSEAGILSTGGEMRLFAGVRNDPFFFNLSGFRATAETVTAAASDLTFDDEGCPAVDSETSNALVTQLRTEPGGGEPIDDFADSNVLAIVLQVDKTLLNGGGPILGVTGLTNSAGS